MGTKTKEMPIVIVCSESERINLIRICDSHEQGEMLVELCAASLSQSGSSVRTTGEPPNPASLHSKAPHLFSSLFPRCLPDVSLSVFLPSVCSVHFPRGPQFPCSVFLPFLPRSSNPLHSNWVLIPFSLLPWPALSPPATSPPQHVPPTPSFLAAP